MNRSQKFVCRLLALALLLAPLNLPLLAQEQTLKQSQTWTAEEALAQLELYPQDSYLQYVALQLARRENKTAEIAGRLERILFGGGSLFGATDRRASIDLFSIFTGALAVQESLQLDTMRGGGIRARFSAGSSETETASDTVRQVEVIPAPTEPAKESNEVVTAPQRKPRGRKRAARKPTTKKTQPSVSEEPPQIPAPVEAQPSEPAQKSEEEKRRERAARRKEIVSVASLTGPTVQSHPWEKMLAGRKPELSPLADYVPEDFYFVEFRSLSKLLEAADQGDLWSTHLFNQAYREARTHNIGERIRQQLALDSSSALRPFYDLVIEDIAITGSDLFLREGSDVTLIFRVRQPDIFRSRLESFAAGAEKSRPDAKRATGNYLGVDYTQLATPERELSVITAWLAPNVCVRGNSLAALRRVIAAFKGQAVDGATAQPLARTTEFAYIRTLMPRGAREEDGFVYLSDPFIRRMVGPQLKLTERRRMLCYNHLRMLGHAALLHLTENGKKPDSLAALAETRCSPGLFGQDELVCPDGGKYSLGADGMTGSCSHHGNARFMTPNLEIPVTQVNGAEADEYNAFLKDYNQYWRMFFDPIALRLKVSDKQYRLETIVLPLIDNSIYTGLATVLGGAPEPLDALPVSKRNIFSFAVRFNKEKLLELAKEAGRGTPVESVTRELNIPVDQKAQDEMFRFFEQGIGNQIGFHIYDAAPMFDLNMSALLGLAAAGAGRGQNVGIGDVVGIALTAVIAMINTPICISVPVKDVALVDKFMDEGERIAALSARRLQRGGLFGVETDYFGFPTGKDAALIRAFGIRFGPVKLRFFTARIGSALYVASKPFILEELYELEKNKSAATALSSDTTGHAMAQVRAENWNQVLGDYRLAWAENHREACLNNLGAIASAGRALAAQMKASGATMTESEFSRAAHQAADRLQGVHSFCPEGGDYLLTIDGRAARCSIHGTAATPRQPAAPNPNSSLDKLMRDLKRATATLEFTEDGLRAVVSIERK